MERMRQFLKKAIGIGMKISDRFNEDCVTVYSAQASYFIVVSIIPFAVLLVSLIQFLMPEYIESLVDTILLILPGNLGEQAANIVYGIFRSSGSMISLSALLSLWSASRGIMGLQSGLHVIYHVAEQDNYIVRRLKCVLYTFVFIIAIVLALVLLVLGNNLEELISENFSFLGQIVRVLLAFRVLLTLAVFILAFTLLYRFLTGRHWSFLQALPGVLLATVGWVVFSWIFSIYMSNFSMYSNSLYGSMGALILLFMWIYFCIFILMAGAELNVYLDRRYIYYYLEKASEETDRELLEKAGAEAQDLRENREEKP